MSGIAELELDKDEAEKLGKAIENVGQYYGASFDPKKVAMFRLGIAVCGIYGVRVFAIRNRLANERAKRAQPPQPAPKPTPINTRNVPTETPVNVNGKATEPVPRPIPGWGEETGSL